MKYKKLIAGILRLSPHQSQVDYLFKISEEKASQCRLEVWKQKIFKELHPKLQIRNIMADFKESMKLPAEMLGKKSSEINISKSRRYCMKNISEQDFIKLDEILPRYKQHKLNHPCSAIIDILGVLVLETRLMQQKNKWREFFVIMPTLSPNGNTVIYDLKGHCDARHLDQKDFEDFQYGKDDNFVKSEHKNKIVQAEVGQQLLANISSDLQFLRQIKVIDYSLLLAFISYDQQCSLQSNQHLRLNEHLCLRWGIIDFLQTFNQRKQLQHTLKSIFYKEVSSVDPDTYANRMLEFLKKQFKVKI